MKTAQLHQNKPDWVLLFLIAICLMLLFAGFYGCGINKATQQVLANGGAFNKVGATWARLNPCVVDSTKTLVHDTTVYTDTTYKFLAGPVGGNGQPQKNGASNAPQGNRAERDTLLQTITKTITLHDSVKIVSVDKRQLNICNDSIAWYKTLYANYRADAVKQVDGWKSKARARLWHLIALAFVVAVYLFRKPLLAAMAGLPALLTPKI